MLSETEADINVLPISRYNIILLKFFIKKHVYIIIITLTIEQANNIVFLIFKFKNIE